MQNLRHHLMIAVTSSEVGNWAFFLTIIFLLGLLAFIASTPTNHPTFESITWQEKVECTQPVFGASPELPTLAVRALTGPQGEALCNELHSLSVLSDSFSKIHVQWQLSDALLGRAVAERKVDLLLIRPDAPGVSHQFLSELYRPIAYHAPYQVFLIARDKQPILDADYLQSRVIGLIANTESRSGYIVPMRMFHKWGIPISNLNIRFYAGHAQLRQAMARNEVDVISSYWNADDEDRFPNWRTAEIESVPDGLSWFLATDLYEHTQLRCSITNVLADLARHSESSYFSDLRFVKNAAEACHAE
jgi:phosphonate transport system substrate-binding protein